VGADRVADKGAAEGYVDRLDPIDRTRSRWMFDDDDDGEETEDDAPLFTFRSASGRIFLSAVRPPDDFKLLGDVEEVGDFFIFDEDRAIPTINWLHEEPAVLYRLPETPDYAIELPDGDAPPQGYKPLGSGFAFVIDEEGLKRAIEADQ
jgi:hypothetical protein